MLHLTEAEYRKLTGKHPKPRAWKPRLIADIDGVRLAPGYTVLVLPIPRSKNQESHNIYARGRTKKEWESLAFYAWIKAARPAYTQVVIYPIVFARVKRDRDMDNAVGLDMKGILDGLKGHLVKDDNSELLTLQAVEFMLGPGYPRLELHVLEVE